jgi:hypothetical protein
MKKLIGTAMILLLSGAALFGQKVSKAGTTAAGFLNVDVGARAVGMGGAFVAVAEDATAIYWNPAGVARIPGPEALFSHSRWLADIAFNFAAFILPLGNFGTLGAGATFVSMDEMERTTILQPEGTGERFTAGIYSVGLCYARNLTDRFSIGFHFKFISERIYNSTARGAAFDIGTLFDTQLYGLKIGMSISNYGTKMQLQGRDLLIQTDIDPLTAGNSNTINANLQTDAYELPLIFRVGLSMDVLKGAGDSNLILSLDALHPNDDMESVNIGGEYVFHKAYALRAGYKSLFARDSEEGVSFGAGLRYRVGGTVFLNIDYAYHDFGVLKDVQKFSVGLRF